MTKTEAYSRIIQSALKGRGRDLKALQLIWDGLVWENAHLIKQEDMDALISRIYELKFNPSLQQKTFG